VSQGHDAMQPSETRSIAVLPYSASLRDAMASYSWSLGDEEGMCEDTERANDTPS
jgi:hypothetical protein